MDGPGNELRAEYLRLLSNLEEPADPQAAGAERLRLRELRGQIDSNWASAIERTRLRPDGLYQADEVGGSDLLRFYPDGVVLEVPTNGCGPETAAQVWKWLNAQDPHYSGKWTLCGDQLSFYIRTGKGMDPNIIHPQWSGDSEEDWRKICEEHNARQMAERTEYNGVVGPQTLAMRWHSYQNGADGTRIYRFVKLGNK